MADSDWGNLPIDLVVLIAQRLALMEDFIAYSATCKAWLQSTKLLIFGKDRLLLPPRSPWLMLSDNVDDIVTPSHRIKQRRSEDIKPRGFFKLSSAKTYGFELPEASGRKCLGAGHGWFLTLGVDLNINLLHPFSRQQILLPPMLSLPEHYHYCDIFWPEEVFHMFIKKAALSANPKSSHDRSTSVMVIYGERRVLAVARLGDKVWTRVCIDSVCFDDVVFYRGKYYVVDCHGVVFVCDLVNEERSSATAIAPAPSGTLTGSKCSDDVVFYRGNYYVKIHTAYCYRFVYVCDLNDDEYPSAKAIAPAPSGTKDWIQKYLVEFSGDLLLVQRIRVEESTLEQPEPNHVVFDSEEEECDDIIKMPRVDYTIKFSVLKLEESRLSNCEEGKREYPYGWVGVSSLGNKSLFIGSNQSVCFSDLKKGCIKPNCIYFTDDNEESYGCRESDGRGGRDMGIYHMESGITEPLFQATSRHRYSPPFWYV